ncbi:unnamed protein product [Peniophora sp. CBMAI 1063]|nr:unnamed protein product [Peniophora sp. CBMAI 1063]
MLECALPFAIRELSRAGYVVCEILYLLAVIDPPGSVRYAYPPRKTLGWINVTHVCRRWRAIGLDLASLWATNVSAFPNVNAFTQAAIARARETDVVITLERDLPEVNRAVFRDFVANSPGRIRELTDTVLNPRHWYKRMKNKDFPRLLVLSLTSHGSYTNDTPGTFSINAPNLRSLTLNEPTFAVVAPQLRSLCLRCKKNRMDCTLEVILKSLRCAPNIEHLEVWVPLHIQSAAGVTGTVNLPHARYVEI